MSQENVELVRRLTEAFEARDIDAFVAAHRADAEVRNLRSQIVGPYRGHAGIRRMAEETFDMAPDYASQIDEIRDCGSRVLNLYLRGSPRPSVGFPDPARRSGSTLRGAWTWRWSGRRRTGERPKRLAK